MSLFGFSEPVVRLSVFITVLTAMALLELFHPKLERDEMRGALKTKRWFTNISMVVLSSLCLRIIFPAAAVGAAIWLETKNLGLFNLTSTPVWVAGILSFVILDFIVWFEHLVSHKWSILWRIHRMHHADNGFDVTTALRFHPLEIVLSMIWKIMIIAVLGAPAVAVLVFEIVLNGMAMFNHSNVKLPTWLDQLIRPILVTPDMHRVHHSSDRNETDSNYGFNFSFWDRIFMTYSHEPKLGHDGIEIGLKEYRGPKSSNLIWALLLPFRKNK
jgi:sterol desaturase/sphingolipid hydroxylase (fatty acid hydroxylase superfamily)